VARTTEFVRAASDRGLGGVTITAESPHNIGRLDGGIVVHPLFGNRMHWYTETVQPGWWTKPVQETEPSATDGADQALESTKNKIEGL
jgi:hypothetical protein